MARAKNRVPGVAHFNTRFTKPEPLVDWERIERVTNCKFSKDQKDEILECAVEFDAMYALQSQGSETVVYETLLGELRNLSEQAIRLNEELSGWVHPLDETEEGKSRQRAFAGMTLAASGTPNLRESLELMANAGLTMKNCLDVEALEEPKVSSQEPLTVGLSAFIDAALRGAVPRSARGGTPGYSMNQAYEFGRWGISIGPQSEVFRNFCEALFGEEISRSRLKGAFAKMRDEIDPVHTHFSLLTRK